MGEIQHRFSPFFQSALPGGEASKHHQVPGNAAQQLPALPGDGVCWESLGVVRCRDSFYQ